MDLTSRLEALKGRRSAVIYPHDNPDPDALAAAMGLGLLLERELGLAVTLAQGGIVGRAENRAMVDALGIALTAAEDVDPSTFDVVALVDSQPETGNNSLPRGHRVDIVIDHHHARPGAARAPWIDIRPALGATSTIVLEYLRERGIALPATVATAFFYALRSETRDLGRQATEAERDAYIHLVPLVDHHLLYRILHPKVPREHFVALDHALRSAMVFQDFVAVNLGGLAYPDLVAEVADLLLSYDGARFVLCMGRYAGAAYLSLRTEASEARAGTLMRNAVGADGAAGGHGTMAGARLHVPIGSDAALDAAFTRILERFCAVLGRDATNGFPLVDR